MKACDRCGTQVPRSVCPHCGAAVDVASAPSVRPAFAALLLGLAACNGEDTNDVALYGVAVVDADEDGFDENVDCDDSDPDVNPDATEVTGDGIDNDCDETTPDE